MNRRIIGASLIVGIIVITLAVLVSQSQPKADTVPNDSNSPSQLGNLTVKLLGEQDQPLTNQNIVLFPIHKPITPEINFQELTDAQGIARFTGLDAGRYFITVYDQDDKIVNKDDLKSTVDIQKGADQTLDLLIRPRLSLSHTSGTPRPTYQCIDHIDNDTDGKTDYPADPGCTDGLDNDERDTTPPPAAAITAPSLTSAQYSSNIILGKKVTLVWTDKSNNEQGFEIQRGETTDPSSFRTIGRVGVNVKTFDDRSILPGKRYYYRVRAYANQGGRMVYSDSNILGVQVR